MLNADSFSSMLSPGSGSSDSQANSYSKKTGFFLNVESIEPMAAEYNSSPWKLMINPFSSSQFPGTQENE